MSTFAVDEPAAVDLLPDRRRLALRLALVAGVLAALTFAVTSLPGLDEVRDAPVRRLARLAASPPRCCRSLSCLAFVAAFRGVFCHRLPWRLSYEVGMAAQGTNVLLPSGGAGGLALAALGAAQDRHADRAPRAPDRRLLRADELGELLHRRDRGVALALTAAARCCGPPAPRPPRRS